MVCTSALGDGCDRQREDEDCKHVPNAKCLPDPNAPANQIDLKCICPYHFKYKSEHKACEKRRKLTISF